jgi:hypothetical protein
MKKRIRLTEGDLHRIVKQSVKRVLNEVERKSPWEEHFNSTYNLPGSDGKFCKQGITDGNLKQLNDYLKACGNIIQKLKNYTPIQDNKEIWEGIVLLDEYLSNAYSFINYRVHNIS